MDSGSESVPVYYVTFEKKPSARTGNILFQYLMCKLISLLYNHTYIPIEEFNAMHLTNVLTVHEENAKSIVMNESPSPILQHIRCDGFFQQSQYYIPRRSELLQLLYKNKDDYWISYNGAREVIGDFLYRTPSPPTFEKKSSDIFISLRLDDFIQLPRETSDIIPPQYYLDIIEREMARNMENDGGGSSPQLYIICDTLRHDWERKYMDFFNKWSPVRIEQSVMEDCHIMRDCPLLIHSNSTLCWFMSFLSQNPNKIRYIPQTHFYGGQSLGAIADTDIVQTVCPLPHHDVYHLNVLHYLKTRIYPLSYCIPDECIVDESVLENKTREIAELVPGNQSTYRFDANKETEYNIMYREALFAHTMKKGGWDCLRHYEIMANGCIPIFRDLDKCPQNTLVSFPKDIVMEANRALLPWNYNNKPLYDEYVKKMLYHVREHCSATANAKYILSKLPKSPKNVLLIMGNIGVNYTRETSWIGLKRYIQSIGGVAAEYPKIDFLYKSFRGNKSQLYGNGFTYSMRLEDDYAFSNEDMIKTVKSHFFDIIIYGKVGPDELHEGSHPNMPLWEHVFKRYTRDEIVFLYGGDECTNLCAENSRYYHHIMHHSQFGHCFVRELQA
jgi:hypothetical protein